MTHNTNKGKSLTPAKTCQFRYDTGDTCGATCHRKYCAEHALLLKRQRGAAKRNPPKGARKFVKPENYGVPNFAAKLLSASALDRVVLRAWQRGDQDERRRIEAQPGNSHLTFA